MDAFVGRVAAFITHSIIRAEGSRRSHCFRFRACRIKWTQLHATGSKPGYALRNRRLVSGLFQLNLKRALTQFITLSKSGQQSFQSVFGPNLLERGKPVGGRRPAWPRSPRHSARSSSERVKLRPELSVQVRPVSPAKTRMSETLPSR